MSEAPLAFPERAALVRRAAARLCVQLGWAPLHEVTLPSGRRADILALCPDGRIICIEVKSGLRDFQTDTKWPAYLAHADGLYFAVDTDFPAEVLPGEAGLIVCHGLEAAMVRPAPETRLAPARRASLVRHFAMLAALRVVSLEDPAAIAGQRAGVRAE